MYRIGLVELEAKLAAARAAADELEHIARVAKAAERDRERLEKELAEHEEMLGSEKQDVDRLEGTSLASLFFRILGKREDKLEEERAELLRAILKRDLIRSELHVAETYAETLAGRRAELEGVAGQLEELLEEKERWLVGREGPAADTLLKMAEEQGRCQALLREIDKALTWGERARDALRQLLKELGSARNWGIFDIVGGGVLVTAMKHDKVDEAKRLLPETQDALLVFQRFLEGVETNLHDVEISGFAKFADYFFDSLIFDWGVQSKITTSLESVQRALGLVNEHLDKLNEQRAAVAGRLGHLAGERQAFVAKWGR